MLKATATAEQFFTRSGNESTKGSRKGYSLLGGGENPADLMDEHQDRQNRREAIKARLRLLHEDATKQKEIIVNTRFKKPPAFYAAVQRKATIAVEITELTKELTAIKAEYMVMPDKKSVQAHFVDICRETLTKAQFRAILRQASIRAEQEQNT